MEHLIALPSFDLVAYLMVGIAAIALCDLHFGTGVFFRDQWSVSVGTVIVIAAYVLGHVISTFSTLAIELPVIDGWARRPAFNLLATKEAEKAHAWPARVLLAPYFDRLDDNTRAKIRERKPQQNDIEELFWQAYDTTKTQEHAFERVTVFQQLYIFFRNMSFILLLAAIIRFPQRRAQTSGLHRLSSLRWQSVILLAISVVLFTRYLYFLRAHSIEILTAYAYGTPHPPG